MWCMQNVWKTFLAKVTKLLILMANKYILMPLLPQRLVCDTFPENCLLNFAILLWSGLELLMNGNVTDLKESAIFLVSVSDFFLET